MTGRLHLAPETARSEMSNQLEDFWSDENPYWRELARRLRLAVIQQQYDLGRLTETDALDLLRGALTPGDESSIVDDSDQLKIKAEAKP